MTFDQIWPVFAFFLGGVSTLLIDAMRAKRSRLEELSRVSAERNQFFKDRRDEFELKHLLEVNEAMSELVFAAVSAMNERTSEGQVSNSSRQAVENANRKIVAVRHLILDDEIRELVRLVHGALLRDGRKASMAESYVEPDASAADFLMEARQSIALRIRTLYSQTAI